MGAHTPGPWKTRETEEHWGRVNVHIEGPDDLELASVYQRTTSENKANARLIAAAPEMLDFINEFIGAWESGCAGDSYLLHMARDVFVKAKGEA